jgi:hypothetical protein
LTYIMVMISIGFLRQGIQSRKEGFDMELKLVCDIRKIGELNLLGSEYIDAIINGGIDVYS